MRFCCFFAAGTNLQIALNPQIVTRIHEVSGSGKGTCNIYTNDGHQSVQVRGDFDNVVETVVSANKEEEEVS